jgi:hypothetical protein
VVRLVVVAVGRCGEHVPCPGVQLRRVDDAGRAEHRLERVHPVLVVRPRVAEVAVLPVLDGLDQRALELCPLVLPRLVCGDGESEGPELPRFVERSGPGADSPTGRAGTI